MKINEAQRPRPSREPRRAHGEAQESYSSATDHVELGSEPGVYRYGQRGEPSGGDLQRKAKWHYEQMRALKDQRATHAPFHFSTLGQEPPPKTEPTPRPMLPVVRYLPTQFYPGGEGERAELGPIAGVGPVRLQRIIPRYELSTAETRESGLGPQLELPPQRRSPQRASERANRSADGQSTQS